jgi:hypothetical protein
LNTAAAANSPVFQSRIFITFPGTIDQMNDAEIVSRLAKKTVNHTRNHHTELQSVAT